MIVSSRFSFGSGRADPAQLGKVLFHALNMQVCFDFEGDLDVG
jgi:hypothetical protein